MSGLIFRSGHTLVEPTAPFACFNANSFVFALWMKESGVKFEDFA